MLVAPLLATPTKMRGVAVPDVADVLSKVTHAIPAKFIKTLETGW
jgi:hypothetical protein